MEVADRHLAVAEIREVGNSAAADTAVADTGVGRYSNIVLVAEEAGRMSAADMDSAVVLDMEAFPERTVL